MISELRHKYPLKDLMKILGIARSTYYYYLKEKKDKYIVEKQEILNIFVDSKNTYGYRRIALELRKKGYVINHKTVLKLMKMLKIYGKQRKSKYKSYRGEVGKVAPNILNREFNTNAPYTKLTTDVTEFNVCNEKIYLSPVLDMFNNEILSYSISTSPNFWQTREMLKGLKDYLKRQRHYYTQTKAGNTKRESFNVYLKNIT
ncbi:MAG: IS3 family transposase [Clostridia bacterium]|nr:IS3 family transposase [Clostridia bacterium]